MSSVLAGKAWDTIRDQPYGIAMSDSQSSIEDENGVYVPNSFDSEKIILSSNKKRLIGHAGTLLTGNIKHYPKTIKGELFKLKNLEHLTKKDLKQISKTIDECWEEEDEQRNQFLFLDYSNDKINLHEFSGKFYQNQPYGIIGSGAKYMKDKFPELISKYIKNGVINCPMEELSQIFIETLNHAKQDEFTGGDISWGIITPKRALLINKFAELKKSGSIEDPKLKYLQSRNKLVANLSEINPKFKNHQLEDLFFL